MSYPAMGQAVRVLRGKCELTQRELAHRVGLSRSAISNIENGRHNLTPAVAMLMSMQFGMTFQELMDFARTTNAGLR